MNNILATAEAATLDDLRNAYLIQDQDINFNFKKMARRKSRFARRLKKQKRKNRRINRASVSRGGIRM